MIEFHVPDTQEMYEIAYLVNKGWKLDYNNRWKHPKGKPGRRWGYPTHRADYEEWIEDKAWSRDDAYDEAYEE